MDLLQFARGPALTWAATVFVFGITWRLVGILLLKRSPDFSEARNATSWLGAVKLIIIRSWPRREFRQRTLFAQSLGYIFHVGLVIIVFGFAPHILFFKALTGLDWPNLPGAVINLTSAITLATLIVVLGRRLSHPVLRLLSNFDDYFSWLVTFAPVATGMLAVAHFGARYETLLAIHILSVALLLVWFPFGKLMHSTLVFVSRGTTGALFERKGASI
jgi:nitrate reductase gamma subunit